MLHLGAVFSGWKIRNILFLLLLLTGIVPLAISGALLVRQNSEIFETQEKSSLARSAMFLSIGLNDYLVEARRNLEQLGRLVITLSTHPDSQGLVTEATLRGGYLGEGTKQGRWLESYLESYLDEGPRWSGLRILDSSGSGPYSFPKVLDESVIEALASTYRDAVVGEQSVWRLVGDSSANSSANSGSSDRTPLPFAVVTTPVSAVGFEGRIFVQGVLEIEPLRSGFGRGAFSDVGVFLVDDSGGMLWYKGADAKTAAAVERSQPIADFSEFPLNLTAEYELPVDGIDTRLVVRISPVDEASWGVVLHKPVATAFRASDQMLLNTAIASAVVIVLALVVAGLAARRISRPISRLAESTKEIAAGNFGKRIEASGPGAEIGELAEDFNRMGDQLHRHVLQLERAAQTNRELFIGSMRAFVAAVDAKDPYTRGHSERVAAHSRTIARFLGLSADAQHHVWVGALLHDVGKIGVDDSILRKGGVLTAEEYEQMKLHPVIGAEILSRIEQLREMMPAIRWHHEAWNGMGYPDGRKGEQIPLMARIVGVADTFDAITTSRPYQRAYEVEFALETIRKLAGTRFDAKVVTAFLRAFEAGEVQLRRETEPHAEQTELQTELLTEEPETESLTEPEGDVLREPDGDVLREPTATVAT